MIILPKGYDPAKWESTFLGTGPFKLGSYTPKSGATFTRNESTGARRRCPRRPSSPSTTPRAPAILALTGGTIDVLGQFAVGRRRGAAHRQLQHHQAEVQRAPPAVDAQRQGPVHRPAGPAGDRAHARPARDRPGAVQGLRRRRQRQPVRARLPVHQHQRGPADDRTSPRPSRCSPRPATARGSAPSWSPRTSVEIPQYAQIVAQSAKAIGVNINLKVEELEPVLRQGHVRELRLAGRHDEPGRLRAPRRAERVPDARRSQTTTRRRAPARGTPPTSATPSTTSWSRSTSPPRPDHPEEPRRADRDAAARRRLRSSSRTSTIT